MTNKQAPQVTFTFSLEAIQLIQAGLAHLPLGQSKGLFDAIEKVTQEQLAAQDKTKTRSEAEAEASQT